MFYLCSGGIGLDCHWLFVAVDVVLVVSDSVGFRGVEEEFTLPSAAVGLSLCGWLMWFLIGDKSVISIWW